MRLVGQNRPAGSRYGQDDDRAAGTLITRPGDFGSGVPVGFGLAPHSILLNTLVVALDPLQAVPQLARMQVASPLTSGAANDVPDQ